MTPEPQHVSGLPSLEDVLGTVWDFGSASLGLVAWELWLSEEELRPLWEEALREGLIEPAGHCPATDEPMFSVAPPGEPGRTKVVSSIEGVDGGVIDKARTPDAPAHAAIGVESVLAALREYPVHGRSVAAFGRSVREPEHQLAGIPRLSEDEGAARWGASRNDSKATSGST